jgi:hypothetical protein
MTKRAVQRIYRRHLRLVVALFALAVAIAMVVVEPFPRSRILLTVTKQHGVDAGDLPAIALCVAAIWIALG